MNIESIHPQLVRRKEPLAHLEREFGRIRAAAPPFEPLIVIQGEMGMGKSSLIRTMREAAAADGIPNAIIDFDNSWAKGRYQGEKGFRQVIMDTGQWLSVGQRLSFQGWRFTPLSDLGTATLKDRFFEYLRNLQNYNGRLPVIVAIDSTEECDPALLEKIQQELVVPLVQTQKAVVVMAGRAQIPIGDFELRRREVDFQLQPLTTDQTFEQLGQGDETVEMLSQQLFDLTGGLPGATVFALQRLAEMLPGGVFDPERVEKLKPQLTEELVSDYLFGPKHSRRNIDPLTKKEVEISATPYSFAYTLLGRILSEVLPDNFRGASKGILTRVADELVATTHVQWDSDRFGFAVNPAARRILRRHLEETRPEIAVRVSEISTDHFNRLVDNGNFTYLPAALHSLVSQAKAQGETGVGETMIQQMKIRLSAVETGENRELLSRVEHSLRTFPAWDEVLAPAEIAAIMAQLSDPEV